MNINGLGQFQSGVVSNVTGSTASTLNAATTRLAYGFTVTESKTLSSVQVFLSAIAGTLANTDIVCEIFSADPANIYQPGTLLATSSTVSPSFSASGKYTFGGFSLVLTPGLQYWAVFKNVNATPGTNFPTLQTVGLNAMNLTGTRYPFFARSSTNSGTSWSTVGGYSGVRLIFSDSSVFGVTVSNVIVGGDAWGTNYSGFSFVTPSVSLFLAMCQFNVQITGSPTLFIAKLFEGSTFIADSLTSFNVQLGTNNVGTFFFAKGLRLKPNTTYRVVLAAPSGNVSNLVRARSVRIATDEYSERPFAGTLKRTEFNGTSWTDTEDFTGLFVAGFDADIPMQPAPQAY